MHFIRRPKKEHSSLHNLGTRRLSEEQVTFLESLARRIGDECYSRTPYYITYDDMDRIREIIRTPRPS